MNQSLGHEKYIPRLNKNAKVRNIRIPAFALEAKLGSGERRNKKHCTHLHGLQVPFGVINYSESGGGVSYRFLQLFVGLTEDFGPGEHVVHEG